MPDPACRSRTPPDPGACREHVQPTAKPWRAMRETAAPPHASNDPVEPIQPCVTAAVRGSFLLMLSSQKTPRVPLGVRGTLRLDCSDNADTCPITRHSSLVTRHSAQLHHGLQAAVRNGSGRFRRGQEFDSRAGTGFIRGARSNAGGKRRDFLHFRRQGRDVRDALHGQ